MVEAGGDGVVVGIASMEQQLCKSTSCHQDSYYPLSASAALDYVDKVETLRSRLGGDATQWKVKVVDDDGKVCHRLSYVIEGSRSSVVLKQALPYAMCVGKSWPLPLERSSLVAAAIREHGRHCPRHAPVVYHENMAMAIMVESYCEPPHVVLRKGLMQSVKYPKLGVHMAEYFSKTLFFTSLLFRNTADHKKCVFRFSKNAHMCMLTEHVVFTEPYTVATVTNNKEKKHKNGRSQNSHQLQLLDDDDEGGGGGRGVYVTQEEDVRVKMAVAELKWKFCERTQALIHGDLHSGSIMVTQTCTQVTDHEYTFYGPMAFDIGTYIGNLMIAFFAHDGLFAAERSNDAKSTVSDYKNWLLNLIEETWTLFADKLRLLWTDHTKSKSAAAAATAVGGGGGGDCEEEGEAYPVSIYGVEDDDLLSMAQEAFLEELFEDSVGFAAIEMIRRIVGVVHVADFQEIGDADVRAACEGRALSFARAILVCRREISTVQEMVHRLASWKVPPS